MQLQDQTWSIVRLNRWGRCAQQHTAREAANHSQPAAVEPAIARRRLPAAATPGHASSRHSGSPETRAGQIPAMGMVVRATRPSARPRVTTRSEPRTPADQGRPPPREQPRRTADRSARYSIVAVPQQTCPTLPAAAALHAAVNPTARSEGASVWRALAP